MHDKIQTSSIMPDFTLARLQGYPAHEEAKPCSFENTKVDRAMYIEEQLYLLETIFDADFCGAQNIEIKYMDLPWKTSSPQIAEHSFKALSQHPRNHSDIILYISMNSLRVAAGWHAVAGKYSPANQELIWQDSNGHNPPDEVMQAARIAFPDLKIKSLNLRQQGDHYSCAYFTIYNMFSFANGFTPDENIDPRRLRWALNRILPSRLIDQGYKEFSEARTISPEEQVFINVRKALIGIQLHERKLGANHRL